MLKTIAALAQLHCLKSFGAAGGYQKRVSPIFSVIIQAVDADDFPKFEIITSLAQAVRWDLVDDDGIVQLSRRCLNFSDACAQIEAWKIRDLERRADLSVGLPMFLQPQAE